MYTNKKHFSDKLVHIVIPMMEYIANKIGLTLQAKISHIAFPKIIKPVIKILDLYAIIHLMITTVLFIIKRIIAKLLTDLLAVTIIILEGKI